jgi:hypothetical protein
MPIMFPPQSGTCANCGQHWTASFPAFDVYCPQCHACVMRLNALTRLGHALAIAGVLMALGAMLVLAMVAVAGTAGLVIGVGVTAIAVVLVPSGPIAPFEFSGPLQGPSRTMLAAW